MPQRVTRYTPQEYYRLEHEADYKSDFYNGEIFAMSGGTAPHSRIAVNLMREIENRIEGGPCRTYSSDLRMKVSATGLRTYPDVSVYCEELTVDPEDPFESTYTNPTVIFEVLSKSTQDYDRGFKAENYRLVASLKAYVLVSQIQPHVEIYERSGDGWEFHEYRGLDAVLKLPPLGIELPLSRIYQTIHFESGEPPYMKPASP